MNTQPEILFSSDPIMVNKILSLQLKNLRQYLSPEEIDSQGFVYVQHDPNTLKSICKTEPPVLALDGDILAGYALCMNKEHSKNVPELVSLFEAVDHLNYKGIPLKNSTYLACGQICIAKEYRGQNLMGKLYGHMQRLNQKYEYCITEVSSQNKRSLYAHFNVGFQCIDKHVNIQHEEWQILLWDWGPKPINLKSFRV